PARPLTAARLAARPHHPEPPTTADVTPAAPRRCGRIGPVVRGDGRLSHELLPGDKGPQDACGVFGVWAPGEEVSRLTYFGLYALQHRGQEAAGIATSDGEKILVYKDTGLVSQVFDDQALTSLTGHIAV